MIMPTKIKTIIGATDEEIENKKFNIFIPISLGNKWFTKEKIKQYIFWALKHSKYDVIIIIADKLHQINLEVKDHYNSERAKRKAERISSKIEIEIKEIIEGFDKNEQEKIAILRWGDIDQERRYISIKKEVYSEFDKNKDFRKTILNIVKENVRKLKNREFSESEVLKLSEYVLNELPIFLYGVEYNRRLYNLHPYPVFTKICDLIDKIQNGEFNDFYKRIGKPIGVIAELDVI